MYNITSVNVTTPPRATLTFDDEPFMVVNTEDVEAALRANQAERVLRGSD